MTTQKHSREVNNLLHNLRGEQFRHLQNVQRSREHLSAIPSYNSPTLPVGLTIPDHGDTITREQTDPSSNTPTSTVAWRARALSIAASRLDNFTDSSRVPSLALLCLKMILADCTTSKEFRDVIPFIPSHLRRDVVRYCAIHSPLPGWKLYALFGAHGHTDGEIIIVGPSASLHEHHFLRVEQNSTNSPVDTAATIQDWETEDAEHPLHSLILLSTRLNTSTLLSFPATLTHLSLVDLATSIPLHRLPKTCPLLILLDISDNWWLNDAIGKATHALEKIEWSRWGYLEVLGLRGCYLPVGLLDKLNKDRWDDVEVVQ